MSECPKGGRYRPDFMAPSPRVVMKGTIAEIEEELALNGIDEDENAFDGLDSSGFELRYYESPNALGQLYRQIDEREFLASVQAQTRKAEEQQQGDGTLTARLWRYVESETSDVRWRHLREWAMDVKESYETRLLDTMHQFSGHSTESISELEVFVGTLLGRDGGTVTRRARRATQGMKEKFEIDVELTVSSIKKGSDGEDSTRQGALPRAIACLAASMERQESLTLRQMKGRLESFRYLAAAVCLDEMGRRESEEVVWQGRGA